MTILLLIQKIISLFLVLGAGFLIVRCRILKPEDSRILSKICVYLIIPCVMINSFQVDLSAPVRSGMLLAFAAAVLVHIGFLLLAALLSRVFHFKPVETASIVYPNAINLIMPIVMSVWGDEYLIYASAFSVVQQCMMWSHGKALMSGKKQIRIRDLFFNVQMICVFIGLFLLFTGIRLPQIVRSSMETVTSSMAAVSMLIIGMVVSSVSWKEIFRYKRVWVIAALRLLACPLAAVLLFRLTGLGHFAAEGSTILTICVLSTASPSANMVVTMAQLFHQDEKYAGVINVVTVLLCVITMPAMLAVCVSLFR